jgi:hypothetical protein
MLSYSTVLVVVPVSTMHARVVLLWLYLVVVCGGCITLSVCALKMIKFSTVYIKGEANRHLEMDRRNSSMSS